mmetsp:Transcript_6908/g.7599  ORF Transcript_6908/g.7599 Transcript_6908/m.7599 type:complete len:326 (+) Transcript_6908:61-1038(+)
MEHQTPRQMNTHADSAVDMARRMGCGGLAGCIAKTVTNPLERIKMLSQTGEHGLKQHSILSLYRNIIKNEGFIGLWAGNGVNLLRIFPAKAIVFATNDMYQNFFRRSISTTSSQRGSNSQNTKKKTQMLPSALSFLSGGLAGMTASAVTYPLDFARGRISGKLASRSSDGVVKKEYKGIVSTILLTIREEGAGALYKGVTPTLIGALPYEGIKFGTVGILDTLFPPSSSSFSPTVRKMIFGGCGGVAAGIVTYPNDTIRRLLQLQGSRGTETFYSGYWDCVQKTYRIEGLSRFYRGATINIIRMAPNSAVQFGSYEILKQWTSGL